MEHNVCYTEVLFTLYCVPLLQHKICTPTTINNTKHVRVPMGTANINAYFQGTGILVCFAVETSNFILAASLL